MSDVVRLLAITGMLFLFGCTTAPDDEYGRLKCDSLMAALARNGITEVWVPVRDTGSSDGFACIPVYDGRVETSP